MTRAEKVFREMSDCFPSEVPELFEDAKKTWDEDGYVVRYEFEDGSAILAGDYLGEKIVNAIGFTREQVLENSEKEHIPLFFMGRSSCVNYNSFRSVYYLEMEKKIK